MKTTKLLILFFCILALHESALSQERTRSAQAGAKLPLTIGAGVSYIDRPYKGFDSDEKTFLVPVVLYEGKHLFARGQTVGWDFTSSDTWELSVIGEYLNYGYDDSDSDFLDGMRDRDPSIGVGGQVSWKPNNFGVELTAVTDIADESDGSQVRGKVFYTHRLANGLALTPNASLVWQDEDFNDYYYGVRSREATARRSAYKADDDINYRVGLGASYRKPGSSWLFLGSMSYEFLGDEIDDSPIVSDDTEFSAFIGVAYTFAN